MFISLEDFWMVKLWCYLWAADAALTRQGCIAIFNDSVWNVDTFLHTSDFDNTLWPLLIYSIHFNAGDSGCQLLPAQRHRSKTK